MDPRTKPSPLFATDEISWIGLCAGPFAWFAAHALNYAIVPWSCATHRKLPLHLVSLVALLIVAVGTVIARRDCGITRQSAPTARTRRAGPISSDCWPSAHAWFSALCC